MDVHDLGYCVGVFRFGRTTTLARNRGQDYKEKEKLDSNKTQTQRARTYEVTSFLCTDFDVSTETCSKNVFSLGPRTSGACIYGNTE